MWYYKHRIIEVIDVYKNIILICFSLFLILIAVVIVKNVRKKRKYKKEKNVFGEEKQSIETDLPTDDPAPIIPISGLDEKSEAALKIEMLLKSVSDDDAAALPMPIIEKYVEGNFLLHVDKAIRGFLETGIVTVNNLANIIGTGYSQATGYMDRLERAGIVGTKEYSDERQIMLTSEEYEKVLRRKMLNYPNLLADFNVSTIIKQLSTDMYLLHTHCLDDVDKMNGIEFEYWCADLLRKLGYQNITVTQESGDQGVDITAVKDDYVLYGFQCKRHSKDQGNTPVQEIYAGIRLYRLHVGVAITNQYFTPKAKELASATGVILWDRDWLKLTLRKLYEDGESKGAL